MRIHALAVLFTLLGLLPLVAQAENSTKIPGYTIHHNVITTDNLDPVVAKAYNLRRSSSRAMLNVSVIKDIPGTVGKPVTAVVNVSAKNLQGQPREIPMRVIHDGEAVYYIGDFLVAHREILNFTIEVKPDGSTGFHTAKLTQEFFTK